MQDFITVENAISLVTLTVMEIVLGIDNVLFVSIIAGKLPKSSQKRARFTGLSIALLIRAALLFSITALLKAKISLFSVSGYSVTVHDIIMFGGGIFLMYKSIVEIHEKIEGETEPSTGKKKLSFHTAILQIILMDVIFSFDSILTAIGVAKNVWIMILAVVISMFIMIAAADYLGRLFHKYPSIKMLALAFLLMIGFLLCIDGLPDELHVEVPKSYLYFAMAFAFGVELLNIRARTNTAKDRD